jgi:hypothetical protein
VKYVVQIKEQKLDIINKSLGGKRLDSRGTQLQQLKVCYSISEFSSLPDTKQNLHAFLTSGNEGPKTRDQPQRDSQVATRY